MICALGELPLLEAASIYLHDYSDALGEHLRLHLPLSLVSLHLGIGKDGGDQVIWVSEWLWLLPSRILAHI